MPRMRGVYSEASDGADETGCSGLRRASKGSRGRRSSAVDEASLNESALDYSPEEFELSELVLARNPLRQDTWWPVNLLNLFYLRKTKSEARVSSAENPPIKPE